MYGIDDDFANSYNAKKIASEQRIPFIPFIDFTGALRLKRVKEGKSKTKGKFFEFSFEALKSNDERVLVGAQYIARFNVGASEVTNEMCWRNMTPILMAALGTSNVLAFNAPKELGEFLNISKDDPATGKVGIDLDLDVGIQRKMEAARVNKDTGKMDPKNLNDDGSVKNYPRDTFTPVAATVAAA